MAKAKEVLKQICFPTDIIMDYDPNGDPYYIHKLLMKEIVETFQKKYGVNLLRGNPHMKCYLMDEKLEEVIPKKPEGLRFRFQDALNEVQINHARLQGAIGAGRNEVNLNAPNQINWDFDAQPIAQPAPAEPEF